MSRALFALAALLAARLAIGDEGEDTMETAAEGAMTQAGRMMDSLSDFLGQQEDSELDEGGELSIAYSSPRDGKVQTVRLKMKDLTAVTPAMLLGSGSGSATMSAEEEAAEGEALDEAIALATEGISFMGEEGPSAATVLQARVAGSTSFRQLVSKSCVGEDEACRRAAGQDILCKLAKAAKPSEGASSEQAAAVSKLCGVGSEAEAEAFMLNAEKAKTSVKAEESKESDMEAASVGDESMREAQDLAKELEGEDEAPKPWESVEKLARSMLEALQDTISDGGYKFQWQPKQ